MPQKRGRREEVIAKLREAVAYRDSRGSSRVSRAKEVGDFVPEMGVDRRAYRGRDSLPQRLKRPDLIFYGECGRSIARPR